MADPRSLRTIRLNNEYDELTRLSASNSMIKVEPLDKANPHEKYTVTFNIRTIVDPKPKYRNSIVCTLTLPAGFPTAEPILVVDQKPYPFHINWYTSGRWCCGGWSMTESLSSFLLRAARVLQFDPGIANRGSVANHDAIPFWDDNCANRRVMPCDKQPLPDIASILSDPPKKSRITLGSVTAAKPAEKTPSRILIRSTH